MNVALLRGGVHIGSQYLLTAAGRKTGIPRSTPISVVTVGRERYVVSAFSEADWVKNVRAAREGTLARGKRTETVSLIELPELEREPVLRAFFAQVPGGVRFFESPDPDAVVASASRYPVFRVLPIMASTLPQPID